MPKVSIITLPFRKTHLIKPVYDAMFAQTHRDLEVIAVIHDSTDWSKEIIQRHYPQVKLVEPGKNLFFASGVNLGIKNSTGEFIQLVNDDLILEPNYIEEMLKVFADPNVVAATGKILRYDFEKNQKLNIIDTTGLLYWVSGRIRDRGQLQEDRGQFDTQTDVWGVSGAGAMYRKSALEKVKYCGSNLPSPNQLSAADEVEDFFLEGRGANKTPPLRGGVGEEYCEYFDEDFVMYWEDGDLAWRLKNAGFKAKYVPSALAYHGRTAGQSEGGYLHLFNFIKHHKKLSAQIRQWNYKNHILMYIKNAEFIFHPAFIIRELGMFGYIFIFEISTLKVLPELFRQIPKIWKKRKVQTL